MMEKGERERKREEKKRERGEERKTTVAGEFSFTHFQDRKFQWSTIHWY
jgi:hypothetical protein